MTGFLAASLLMLSLVCRGGFAFSQLQQAPGLPPPPSQNGMKSPLGQEQDTHADPSVLHAQEEAAKKRNLERQKRMVADANKIVELAQEISADVDKGGKHALSPATAKKAEEIEKLAKGVKERMKSEN